MKKIFYISTLFSITLLSLAGCNKEVETTKQDSSTSHVVHFVSSLATTKTTMEFGNNNVVKYSWDSEDVTNEDWFQVYEGSTPAGVVDAKIDENSNKLLLDAMFDTALPTGEVSFTGIMNGTVQSEQTSCNDETHFYDRNSDVLIAKGTATRTQDDAEMIDDVEFSFSRIVAISKMTIKGLPVGAEVDNVTVSANADTPLVGTYDVLSSSWSTPESNKIEISCAEVVENEAEGIVVYFVSRPISNASITVDLTVDGINYTKTTAAVLTLTEGNVKGYTVRVAEAPKEIETATKAGFDAVSGRINEDISYEAKQGEAGTAPGIYNNRIRLYQNGGFVTISGEPGVNIQSVTVTTTATYATTTVGYSVDDNVPTTGETVAKSSSYTISNLNNQSVSIYCLGTDNKTRLEIASLEVQYTKQQKDLQSLSLSGDYQTEFEINTIFNHEGLIVTANYVDGSNADVSASAIVEVPDMTSLGEKNVVVSYGGKTESYSIQVIEPTVVSISISGDYETKFIQNTQFNHEGVLVTALYSNGTSSDVTANASFSNPDMSVVGKQNVTVTFDGKTAEYPIYVKVSAGTLNSEIVDFTDLYNEDANVADYEGQSFSMSFAKPQNSNTPTKYYINGEAVRAYIGNTITIDAIENIARVDVSYDSEYVDENATITGYGTKTAVITFSKTCRFTSIKVYYILPTLSSISVSGQKTEFIQNDSFSFGGVVTAAYSDGSIQDVTDETTFSGYDLSNTGEQTVTVSYAEGEIYKTTSYKISVTSVTYEVAGTLASWGFDEDNYPENKTDFSNNGDDDLASGTFYLNGTGSQWNTTKGYAFTAVTDITIAIKATKTLKKGAKITFSMDTFYNKASNAPMTGFTLKAAEGSVTASTTGLSVTSFSLSTSSATKSVVYTLQNDVAKDGMVKLILTGTGKAGAGQGYMGNINAEYATE